MIRATSRLQPLVPASLFQLLIPLFSAVVLATTHAAEPAAPNSLADLQQRITSRISEPRFASALWGVKVASLDSGNTLYEHNAQKLFSPASNSKLYTVALALTRLGPDFRIKTSLYSQARPGPDGKLSGDLVVFGRGDPTICARLHKDDIYAALEPLVDVLTNAGVKEVSGNLVADDSFIHGAPWGSGWDWGDAENYYGAEISALTINDNCLEIRVQPGSPGDPCVLALAPPSDYLKLVNETHTAEKGASRRIRLFRPLESNTVYVSGQLPEGGGIYTDDVTCHQPAGLFLSFLKQAMERHGIRVDGTLVVSDPENPGMKPLDISPLMELGHMESPPMTEIARDILKPSQNLYADLVLAQVGEHSR
ncbi:MAG TPA: D-alanyl-D-alanine carboxypeptidase/D-alanyl-D-alanine-endopeptidase, partial [Verrucomicrobiae bacterium]|nr:D-alanyl-D-alanine carboxypeptidase/D-alanyl-D-alanine-endopeptidase [Verrucomicrobiae bacterium]